ncbi:DUF294 nucleotidyltransferase-like domain-containing protein [Paenibacillus chitinolyticus]|uniref:DUF294 nucleotidyltransferase-like domain-containing protein n=1 Tax=Paenibacillus chitinolyticus TaxID=79263 RepID=UPI002DBB32D3|nr:DUF294 nucleotidyltransferase-like domain-containing protein [Paenibacillus chitinolyticus]MEC0249067.1 DUF294 nucleotidyltransferase-like domain-containing protein [Paenibacillus chitinolyticus]
MEPILGSAWQLLRTRINRAAGSDELALIRADMQDLFRRELGEETAALLYEELNFTHDTMIRKMISLAEKRLAAEGAGEPPLPYAFLLMGSGGREEQTPWSDQDNGLVYENPLEGTEAAADGYFSKLAQRIRQGLELAGYPPCTGKVLAENRLWRRSEAGWKDQLNGWFAEPVWENARYLLIAADLRCVYGSEALADRIKQAFHETIALNRGLLLPLLTNTLHHKVSLGLLGRVVTERYGPYAGGVDIKYGLYIPLVNAVRLLALENGISDSSTLKRIDALIDRGAVTVEFGTACREVFLHSLKMRLNTPYYRENGHFATAGIVPAGMLTRKCRAELKRGLKFGKRLQRQVIRQVRGSVKQGGDASSANLREHTGQ